MTRTHRPGLPFGYESQHWGIERIVLDSLSNHLPTDSDGTRISIDFHADGKWYSYHEGKELDPQSVAAVRFVDDGRGYDDLCLGILLSTKKEDEKAIGEKGEGLKMAVKASLEVGIDVELESTWNHNGHGRKSWRAVAYGEKRELNNTTATELVFAVDDLPTKNSTGSQTTFRNISTKFVEYVQNSLKDKVLSLRQKENLFNGQSGSILDESGSLFVKGIYISDGYQDRLGFGYNLASASPNRDRNNVNPDEIKHGLRQIMNELSDVELIKHLVELGENQSLLEYSVLRTDYKKVIDEDTLQEVIIPDSYEPVSRRNLWKQAFHELYGEKAVLSSTQDDLARLNGLPVIKLDSTLSDFLQYIGIPRSDSVEFSHADLLLKDESYSSEELKLIPHTTGLTIDSGRRNWGALRIVLDTVSNHMADDSGGTQTQIEYYIRNEEHFNSFTWTPDVPGRNEKVYAIRVIDDGDGYDVNILPLFFTTKEQEGTQTGGFGEGTKMVSMAVLRDQADESSMGIKYRSRDGAAVPFLEEVSIDTHSTQRVNFLVAKGLSPLSGSTTTIYNPLGEVADLFRLLHRYVLAFNEEYTPIHQTERATLFDARSYSLENGWLNQNIFANGFYITGEYHNHILFNYDLKISIDELSPDRNNIKSPQLLRDSIKELIQSCYDPGVISRVVRSAREKKEEGLYEFIHVTFDDEEHRDIWSRTFFDLYGNKAVLATDIKAMITAQEQGYTPVHLHDKIKSTLRDAGVLTDRDVISEGLVPELVEYDDLTNVEKRNFALLPSVDAAIFACRDDEAAFPTVKVYSKLHTVRGEEKTNTLGYYHIESDTIYLRRDQLHNARDCIMTYTHERGHQVTGGDHADKEFLDFFEDLGYNYTAREITGTGPVSDTIEELRNQRDQLKGEVKMAYLNARLFFAENQKLKQKLAEHETNNPSSNRTS